VNGTLSASSFSCSARRQERRLESTVCARPDHPSRRAFRKTGCSKKRTHLPENTPLRAKSRTTTLGPFGEVIRATGPLAKVNPFRFSTIYQDDESDLLMYAHRPYSASQGRFLSREPLGEVGANLLFNIGFMDVFGEESRLNPYWIVDNDPVHHYDILGLQSVPVSLTEAMASGNVAQVESILAGMEEGDAGYAVAEAWLKKVAQCEAIWAAYKALGCKGCKGCTTSGQAAANAACLTAEIAGRAAFLKLKCDYCLAGSIAAGSAKQEKGHQTELANKTAALARCVAAAATLPSATPPPPPIVP